MSSPEIRLEDVRSREKPPAGTFPLDRVFMQVDILSNWNLVNLRTRVRAYQLLIIERGIFAPVYIICMGLVWVGWYIIKAVVSISGERVEVILWVMNGQNC